MSSGLGNDRLCHPLAAHGEMTGRVVTVLGPDGYVLVDGLLVRAVLGPAAPIPAALHPRVPERGPKVGDEVALRLEPGRQLLTASSTSPPDKTTPDETTPDKTVPDKTTPDKTTPDKTTADGTAKGTGFGGRWRRARKD